MLDTTELKRLSAYSKYSIKDIVEVKQETESLIAQLIENLSKVSGIAIENIFIDIHEPRYHKKTGELETILNVKIDLRL